MKRFEDGDLVIILDLDGQQFNGEVLTYDPEEGQYWVMVEEFGDLIVGIPEDSDRLLPFTDDDDEVLAELEAPGFGMSSDDLALYVRQFIERATARVKGVGNDQYNEGDYQKFEAMPLDELLDMLQEELQDAAVYAAMLDIRIKRYRDALGKAEL